MSFLCVCVCVRGYFGWLRVAAEWGGIRDDDSWSEFVNGDVRVSLVSEHPAQVATGRPTSLASKRKQRKMRR